MVLFYFIRDKFSLNVVFIYFNFWYIINGLLSGVEVFVNVIIE